MRFAILVLALFSGLVPSVRGLRVPALSPAPTCARALARCASPAMRPVPKVPYKHKGTEFTSWMNVYDRLYRERILFCGQAIDDSYANQMIAVFLYLESEDAKAPVSMCAPARGCALLLPHPPPAGTRADPSRPRPRPRRYVNSAGGPLKSGMALYDTMCVMPFEVHTVNLGMCASTAAFLVASGTKGKRVALPNARFALQNPGIAPPLDDEGRPTQRMMQASDMQLEVEEVLRDKARMVELLATFTGKPVDAVRADFERDFYLDARQAVEYGITDKVLANKPRNPKAGSA